MNFIYKTISLIDFQAFCITVTQGLQFFIYCQVRLSFKLGNVFTGNLNMSALNLNLCDLTDQSQL